MLKEWIKNMVPDQVTDYYRRTKNRRQHARNRQKNAEEIFTDIYLKGKWGGSRDHFCSGEGSADQYAQDAYIETISQLATAEGFKGLTFVDLGCGDFQIGRRLCPLCSQYIGVDIVLPLIMSNREQFQNSTIQFLHLNLVEDQLPKGDVCFIRQVFQHLCNEDIRNILQKTDHYKWVFITEHYPTDNDTIVHNMDKLTGGDIRIYHNSGVYLSKPPFNLPADQLQLVLEVPGVGLGHRTDQGVIRTYLYRPGPASFLSI